MRSGRETQMMLEEAEPEGRNRKASTHRQEAIEEYLHDLAVLARQREEIDGKINLIERAIRGMLGAWAADSGVDSSLLEKEWDWERRLKAVVGPSSIGLTEAVRRAVWEAKPPGITARQVRDVVISKYQILQGYSNPLAAVHTVLRRLCRGIDDIEQITREDGETIYRLPSDAGVF